MILYGIIVIISISLIVLFNSLFNPMALAWYTYLLWTVLFVVAVVIIDALVAIIIRKLPEKCININSRFYNSSNKKLNLYKKLGVTKWKDLVPELGNFTSFHKNRVEKPNDNEYISRFILEVCYGISIHFWSMFLGLLILLIDYKMFIGGSNLFLTIGLPITIVNGLLNYLPYVILSFNLPRLKNIYNLNKQTQTR